ncbi:MAG: DUF92 domain-containing protein [Spirochaetia bacterium]
MSLILLLALGLALNAAAAAVALWRGSVDPGGAAAGTLVGALIFACGGPLFWLVLIAFFLSSTGLGHVRVREKEWLAAIHEKGGRRDLFQVLANGGMGMLCAALFRLTGNNGWAVGFAVSFASSNADTWASELGVLSKGSPVSLFTFRPVPRGVSGGVSLYGCAMSLAGALLIALVFAAENLSLGLFPGRFILLAAFVSGAGFIGSLLDSLLGATLQAQYEPSPDARAAGGALVVTERRFSADGVPHRLARGLAFVNNDVVNFTSCAIVTLASVLLAPSVL